MLKNQFGAVVMEGRLTREGVYAYDGTLEYKPLESLTDCAETIIGVPVTIGHPSEFINPFNISELAVGVVVGASVKDNWLSIEALITHQNGINHVTQTDATYLSCGYDVELVNQCGEWTDEFGEFGAEGQVFKYGVVQKGMIPNHVAIVEYPRSGFNAKLEHQDSSEILTIDLDSSSEVITTLEDMEQTENEVVNENVDATEDAEEKVKIDNLLEQIKLLNEQITELTKNLDASKAQVDSLATQKEDSRDNEIARKVEIICRHQDSLKPTDAGLSYTELQKKSLKFAYPALIDKIDNGSPTYVESLYDIYITGNANLTVSQSNLSSTNHNDEDTTLANFKKAQSDYLNKRIRN